jgi:hypothetical protein
MYTLKIDDLTKAHVDFLYELSTIKIAEYRDTEYESVDDFKIKTSHENLSDEKINWFLRRNHNGTYYLLNVLFKYSFIDTTEDAWHFTVEITELGREFLKQNTDVLTFRRCVKCKKDRTGHLCECGEQDNYESYNTLVHKK